MVSGSGSECRTYENARIRIRIQFEAFNSSLLTIAPYNPYSAIMVLRPQHFSVLRHFARRFWNHTWAGGRENIGLIKSRVNKIPKACFAIRLTKLTFNLTYWQQKDGRRENAELINENVHVVNKGTTHPHHPQDFIACTTATDVSLGAEQI